MDLLTVYALTLLVAVLISGMADRSVVSTAVVFLLVGFAVGWAGWLGPTMDSQLVTTLATFALFSILFTDGMRAGLGDVASAWRLPGRALLLGMPLTLLAIAILARVVVGLTWQESFLIGAALSPTDPVFAAAIVGRKEVPHQLRQLLNVESGVNDGLALPVVVIMLAIAGEESPHVGTLLGEMAGGITIGFLLPWLVVKLERRRFLGAADLYKPLLALAIGLALYAITNALHWNEFLSAFVGGITLATVSPEVRDAYHQLGEIIAELLKLAALLLFGVLISVELFKGMTVAGGVFIVLTLLLPRTLALGLALLGSRLSWQEQLVAAWFGPKGFASVVYGLLILKSDVTNGPQLFHLIACVAGLSIIVHSSTDVAIARWFQERNLGEKTTVHDELSAALESEALEELDEP